VRTLANVGQGFNASNSFRELIIAVLTVIENILTVEEVFLTVGGNILTVVAVLSTVRQNLSTVSVVEIPGLLLFD
jgi:hypothetical protein